MTINEKWDKNSKREKILMMVAIPLIIMIAAQLTLFQPIEKKNKRLSITLQSSGVEIDKLKQDIEATKQMLALSSKIKLEKQQLSLEQQINDQKTLLNNLTSSLIPPEKMAEVIETLLKQRGKLKLLSLNNLEPIGLPDNNDQELNTEKDMSQILDDDEAEPLVYRHPLELKFRGTYFQVMEYLKILEESDSKFYWEVLDYKVDKYPQAEVLLRLSTLGTTSEWMGASNSEK